MSIQVINYIGKDKLPVRVTIEYQPYRSAETIDGIHNPEVPPHVEILGINSFGFDLDDILTVQAVDKLRGHILDEMVKLSALEYPELEA